MLGYFVRPVVTDERPLCLLSTLRSLISVEAHTLSNPGVTAAKHNRTLLHLCLSYR